MVGGFNLINRSLTRERKKALARWLPRLKERAEAESRLAGIDWPAAFGGRGATPTEHLIFLEETERAGAPSVGVNFVGLLHAGPTLIAEGSDEQRNRHGDGQGDQEPRRGVEVLRVLYDWRPGTDAR